MSQVSREKQREERRATDAAAPSAVPIAVHVPAHGGCATVDGAPVRTAPGEGIQQAVLNHLRRLALAAGRPVLATIADERSGYAVPLRVHGDGSSSLTAEPSPMPPAGEAVPPARQPIPEAARGVPYGTAAAPTGEFGPAPVMHPGPAHTAHPAEAASLHAAYRSPSAPLSEPAAQPASPSGPAPAPVAPVAPSAPPSVPAAHPVPASVAVPSAPAPAAPPSVPVTHFAPAPAAPPSVPVTHFAPAPAAPPSVPVTHFAPAPAAPPSAPVTHFAPAPPPAGAPSAPVSNPVSASASAAPAPAPAGVPSAPVTPAPRRTAVPGSPAGRDAGADAVLVPTPARGFDAVAEAVLGDDPRTLVGEEGHALLAEPTARISEAVKEGRIETAAGLAERTVTEASAALGPEHPEVLALRELSAYIAYLAGDPVRAFRLSLDLARVRRRLRDAEGSYGNVQSAATAWRAVRDPEEGLRLGRDLIGLWSDLTADEGPAAEDAERLASARARMGRLAERAARTATG